MSNNYQYSKEILITLPEAYTLARKAGGKTHIVKVKDNHKYCDNKPLTGTWQDVPHAPKIVSEGFCQRCFIRLPSHWYDLMPGYRQARSIHANHQISPDYIKDDW